MMILYCSFSALMFGNSPLSALQSHLPPRYLGSGSLSYMKGAVWFWDLDLVISHKEMVCSSRSRRGAVDLTASGLKSGKSLGDLGFCGLVRCLVRFHIIMCRPCHLQVKCRTTIAPQSRGRLQWLRDSGSICTSDLFFASSSCETLVPLCTGDLPVLNRS